MFPYFPRGALLSQQAHDVTVGKQAGGESRRHRFVLLPPQLITWLMYTATPFPVLRAAPLTENNCIYI